MGGGAGGGKRRRGSGSSSPPGAVGRLLVVHAAMVRRCAAQAVCVAWLPPVADSAGVSSRSPASVGGGVSCAVLCSRCLRSPPLTTHVLTSLTTHRVASMQSCYDERPPHCRAHAASTVSCRVDYGSYVCWLRFTPRRDDATPSPSPTRPVAPCSLVHTHTAVPQPLHSPPTPPLPLPLLPPSPPSLLPPFPRPPSSATTRSSVSSASPGTSSRAALSRSTPFSLPPHHLPRLPPHRRQLLRLLLLPPPPFTPPPPLSVLLLAPRFPLPLQPVPSPRPRLRARLGPNTSRPVLSHAHHLASLPSPHTARVHTSPPLRLHRGHPPSPLVPLPPPRPHIHATRILTRQRQARRVHLAAHAQLLQAAAEDAGTAVQAMEWRLLEGVREKVNGEKARVREARRRVEEVRAQMKHSSARLLLPSPLRRPGGVVGGAGHGLGQRRGEGGGHGRGQGGVGAGREEQEKGEVVHVWGQPSSSSIDSSGGMELSLPITTAHSLASVATAATSLPPLDHPTPQKPAPPPRPLTSPLSSSSASVGCPCTAAALRRIDGSPLWMWVWLVGCSPRRSHPCANGTHSCVILRAAGSTHNVARVSLAEHVRLCVRCVRCRARLPESIPSTAPAAALGAGGSAHPPAAFARHVLP